jgi:hypothetical protein
MASPPKKRHYAWIPARRIIETTPSVQPSRPVNETQDPSPPSPSQFIEEPLIDSMHMPSDTTNGFAEFLDDLDTTIVQHENEMAQVPNIGVLDNQQVRTISTYVTLDM